jgi:sigma-B regulation protein RsbU (phosphoserine phosphatase)
MSTGKKKLLSAIGRMKGEEAAAQADLARATKIQFNLLPDRIPTIRGYDMKVHYHSAKEIGGDYYDFIPIDHENLGIVVADVSGKGVPAGMIMTMARTILRLLARGNPSARNTMVKVNKFIARDIKNVMFLTVLYMVLNIRTSTLQVVNCGHNPLILWRAKNYRLVNPQGIAVGLDLGPVFERTLKEDLIQIQRGDRIVAYTDGVVESMNERQEEFGEEAFLEIVSQHGDKSSAVFLNTLVNALTEHQGPATQHDDITVVTFKFS